MAEMSFAENAMPVLIGVDVSKGEKYSGTSAWDDSKAIFGCVCDSSWAVGLSNATTQKAEWFESESRYLATNWLELN